MLWILRLYLQVLVWSFLVVFLSGRLIMVMLASQNALGSAPLSVFGAF